MGLRVSGLGFRASGLSYTNLGFRVFELPGIRFEAKVFGSGFRACLAHFSVCAS